MKQRVIKWETMIILVKHPCLTNHNNFGDNDIDLSDDDTEEECYE